MYKQVTDSQGRIMSDDDMYEAALADQEIILLAIEDEDPATIFDELNDVAFQPFFKECYLDGMPLENIAIQTMKRFVSYRLDYRERLINKYIECHQE